MNRMGQKAVEDVFGKICIVERVRTDILFCSSCGDMTVPDIPEKPEIRLCVTRVPDERFFDDAYWARYGPKPSDADTDFFVVPFLITPRDRVWYECGNWMKVVRGTFAETESGVIVVDVDSMSAWEGYETPVRRDDKFDRRRLEKSAQALKTLAAKSDT